MAMAPKTITKQGIKPADVVLITDQKIHAQSRK